MKAHRMTLVLVDDDLLEAAAVRRAMERVGLDWELRDFTDGRLALSALREEGEGAIRQPFLILLDLAMPRMNGIEFLLRLRADAELRDAVVFVLTTSEDTRDMRAAYALNAAGYFLKSRSGTDYEEALGLLKRYETLVSLPGPGD